MFEFLKRRKKSFKYEIGALVVITIIAWVFFFGGGNGNIFLLIAAILGLYMAMNIGANDVANNMGPAVGSKALTITGAVIIAAIFEAAGVMIAGGDVVDTIKKGIIDPELIENSKQFIAIMIGTLAGAAIWVNIATYLKAPVSTTHSVVGGLIGAGITAMGFSIVDWGQVGMIAASWVISPVMGGVIAVILFISIRHTIMKKEDRKEAAELWLPVYVGLMTWVFITYLLLKGLKPIIKDISITLDGSFYGVTNLAITPQSALFVGAIFAFIVYMVSSTYLQHHSSLLKNSKKFINRLFNLPLIFSVALLSFAHGANDVANAVGPLAAIVDAIENGIVAVGEVGIPIWVMLMGAVGLVLGLSIFGARLIKTVGGEITKLNQTKAFCVALAAAITVLIASQLGLPVSSTHIALGGIFGVGLMKEYRKRMQGKDKQYVAHGMIKTIVLAWVVTLPASGIIASIAYVIVMQFV